MPPGFRPDVWADTFKDFFAAQPGLLDYFDRKDEFVRTAGYGQTVHLPALQLPKTVGITPGNVQVTHSAQDRGATLTIDKFRGHPIPVTPQDEQFNHPDYRNALMREAGRQIKNDTNEIALELAIDAAVTAEVNAGGGALTDAVVLAAKKALDNAEFPAEDRYFVTTPDGENDLLQITTYTSADFNPDAGQQNQQQIAWARGFRLIVLPEDRFKLVTTKRAGMAFHRSAIVAGVTNPHVKLAAQAGQFQDILEIAAHWGQKIAKASGIVRCFR